MKSTGKFLAIAAVTFAMSTSAFAQQGNAIANGAAGAGKSKAPAMRTQATGNPQWLVTDVIATGCNDGDLTFDVEFINLPEGTFVHTVAEAGGLRYMNEQFESSSGTFDDDWSLFDLDDGGQFSPLTGVWPIPTGTEITIRFMLRSSFDGTLLFQNTVVVDGCDTGTLLSSNIRDSFAIPTMGKPALAMMAALMLLLGGLGMRRFVR